MTSPTVFTFTPEAYADEFRAEGFVQIRNAVTPDFLDYARAQALHASPLRQRELPNLEIPSKKRQQLFDFPDNESLESVLDALAALSNLDRTKLIISERHIKFYDVVAPPFPTPHKDRYASQIAVGIPLEVPRISRLVLFPMHGRNANVSGTAITWRDGYDTKAPKQLTDAESVALDTRPNDIVIFCGSSIYHEREHAAGAIVLYLKFNDMGLDPLNENPLPLCKSGKQLAQVTSTHPEKI